MSLRKVHHVSGNPWTSRTVLEERRYVTRGADPLDTCRKHLQVTTPGFMDLEVGTGPADGQGRHDASDQVFGWR